MDSSSSRCSSIVDDIMTDEAFLSVRRPQDADDDDSLSYSDDSTRDEDHGDDDCDDEDYEDGIGAYGSGGDSSISDKSTTHHYCHHHHHDRQDHDHQYASYGSWYAEVHHPTTNGQAMDTSEEDGLFF